MDRLEFERQNAEDLARACAENAERERQEALAAEQAAEQERQQELLRQAELSQREAERQQNQARNLGFW